MQCRMYKSRTMVATLCKRGFDPGRLLHPFVKGVSSVPGFKEVKEKVLDLEINYIQSLGNDSNAPPIFFLPGAFGSIEMDFIPIANQFNTKKYKWIAWDPPGYGKSRPPKREFASERYETVGFLDVPYIKELMNMLGYSRYTLLAWSGAALSAIEIASSQPETVSGLITWGAFGHVVEEMVPPVEEMRKVGLSGIPERRRNQLIDMYGEKCLAEMWDDWCREALRMAKSDEFIPRGRFLKKIKNVQCPSLVIHGMKDALVLLTQAHYLVENLKNSRLHLMQNGTHNLHLRETAEFVKCIENFVDQTAFERQ